MYNISMLEVNTRIDVLYALINRVDAKYTNDGNLYLDFALQDVSGEVNAKLWNAKEEDISRFKTGMTVEISGEVVSYRKELQIKIRTIGENTTIDIAHFLPSAPIEKELLQDNIMNYILSMRNIEIRGIVNKIVKKFSESFFSYPAASKNHHEYVNGLAHHASSMLELGEKLCELYPSINSDLLYAGIILHDIGKVIELSGNVATEYTKVGKLLGHITIAVNEIELAAKELEVDEEITILLQHLVLSHHGKMEFGSPKLPMMIEAEILTYIDNIDARMNMMEKALSNIEIGEFSSRVYSLEGRQFYKHNLSK